MFFILFRFCRSWMICWRRVGSPIGIPVSPSRLVLDIISNRDMGFMQGRTASPIEATFVILCRKRVVGQRRAPHEVSILPITHPHGQLLRQWPSCFLQSCQHYDKHYGSNIFFLCNAAELREHGQRCAEHDFHHNGLFLMICMSLVQSWSTQKSMTMDGMACLPAVRRPTTNSFVPSSSFSSF